MESTPPPTKPKTDARLIISAAATAVGLVLLLFAGTAIWQRYHSTHAKAGVPDIGRTVDTDAGRPAETAPASPEAYEVPADQPRSISLPSIRAEGLIQRVGLTKQNAVVAPSNITFAGWYTASVKPGQEGLSLLDGHVQGYYNPGIFKQLSKLKAGDGFSVEFGDHSRRQFEVISVISYPVGEAGKRMLQHDPAIARQLNLITCDGAYDAAKHEYSNRVLVVSKAI